MGSAGGEDALAEDQRPAPVKRGPLVDAHAHIMPSGLERLARIMGENGITAVINLSGGNQRRGLQTSVAMSRALPGLYHLYNPDWRGIGRPGFGDREAKRLENAVRVHGFRGLKISKALGLSLRDGQGHRIPVDWEGLDPLWEAAGRLGVPVAIHTSDPAAFWEPLDCANERIDELFHHPEWSFHGPGFPSRERLLFERNNVIVRHPATTFIGVHVANNPEELDQVEQWLEAFPNLVIDISARVPELGRHDPERGRRFFVRFHDRILFGTDLGVGAGGLMLGSTGPEPSTMLDVKPFYDSHFHYLETREIDLRHPTPIQGDWSIDGIGLDEKTLQAIYHRNAERIFRLEPAPERSP